MIFSLVRMHYNLQNQLPFGQHLVVFDCLLLQTTTKVNSHRYIFQRGIIACKMHSQKYNCFVICLCNVGRYFQIAFQRSCANLIHLSVCQYMRLLSFSLVFPTDDVDKLLGFDILKSTISRSNFHVCFLKMSVSNTFHMLKAFRFFFIWE